MNTNSGQVLPLFWAARRYNFLMHYIHTKTRTSSRGAAAVVALGAVLVVLILVGLGLTFKRWEGQPPRVMFDRDFNALGHSPRLNLTVEDPETGLRHVTIRLKQKDQDVVLADESFARSAAAKSKSYDIGKLIADKYKPDRGPATLSVEADDYALRNFAAGNRTDLHKDFAFHLQPPRLEVLSAQHYINQGGSECVVYRVLDEAESSGVQVGPNFFPFFASSDDGTAY